jgi:hypothetical protein
MPAEPIPVYLEVGSKKVFACAVDWLGWCRAAKDEEGALEALAAYTERYRAVAEQAGLRFPKTPSDLDVVERVKGNATTDFGAPGVVPKLDGEAVTEAQAARHVKLLQASWAVLERIAEGAPESLRKGPRGGGRDRSKIVAHVIDAEGGYARMIGIKGVKPPELRSAIVELLGKPSEGPLRENGWPARYAARRIAWHALDHAWEIEDRSS